MSATDGQWIWFIGLVAWYLIRHPYRRRARKIATARTESDLEERFLLGFTIVTLFVLPVLHASGNLFSAFDYPPHPWQTAAGSVTLIGFLVLFQRSHADLGGNWSVTLEIRERHVLVTNGVYSRIRHPMYSAFLLWAVAQALLIANTLAGPASLLSIGLLVIRRLPREERLMYETFGDDYRAYTSRTKRLLPGVY